MPTFIVFPQCILRPDLDMYPVIMRGFLKGKNGGMIDR